MHGKNISVYKIRITPLAEMANFWVACILLTLCLLAILISLIPLFLLLLFLLVTFFSYPLFLLLLAPLLTLFILFLSLLLYIGLSILHYGLLYNAQCLFFYFHFLYYHQCLLLSYELNHLLKQFECLLAYQLVLVFTIMYSEIDDLLWKGIYLRLRLLHKGLYNYYFSLYCPMTLLAFVFWQRKNFLKNIIKRCQLCPR